MSNLGWYRYQKYDKSQLKSGGISRVLFKRVLRYAKPYKGRVILLVAAISLSAVFGMVAPLLFREIIDKAVPQKQLGYLNLLTLGMVAAALLNGALSIASRYLSSIIGMGIVYDLRQDMYAHLQSLPLRFYTHTRAGEIISRFNSDVVGAQNAISGTVPTIFTNSLTLIAAFTIMMILEWRLALISMTVIPLFILSARYVSKVTRHLSKKTMELTADMNSILEKTLNINGIFLVKIFGQQQTERKKYSDVTGEIRDIRAYTSVFSAGYTMSLSIATAIGVALVYRIGGGMAIAETLTIGTIVAFGVYLNQLYRPVIALSNVQIQLVTSAVSFERVFEYLDLPLEIKDAPDAVPLKTVHGEVRFHKLGFEYGVNQHLYQNALVRRSRKPVAKAVKSEFRLKDIDFTILPGQTVAVVGQTGSGKSTLTKLLCRFYDVTEGMICVDGHDIRTVTAESLLANISMVPQEAYCFNDTIAGNLRYAKPGATDDEVVRACKAAQIHDFFTGLKKGYDTVIGERGYRLSGGEKQRLSIARAILKDAPILILDEATSHLDSRVEAQVKKAMDQLMQGRTNLVIAHRLSTVLNAGKIIVMDKGTISEMGTHETLMAKNSAYTALFQKQFQVNTGVAVSPTHN